MESPGRHQFLISVILILLLLDRPFNNCPLDQRIVLDRRGNSILERES